MTRTEVAELLENYARSVERIRGVSRTKPHAFVEDKSEVVNDMRQHARRLRTVEQAAAARPTGRPGERRIDGRVIHVEIRRA
ncbi:hypothetical protein [Beijerinckia sp. L45]|uniref:hypothetical protein n=1 Tax=Beijerinckia sp. L45 TaxID=1641855 RepID=UPI00131DC139|nr:hypothetical protein [Beijerinckia sp. L45]